MYTVTSSTFLYIPISNFYAVLNKIVPNFMSTIVSLKKEMLLYVAIEKVDTAMKLFVITLAESHKEQYFCLGN